ncbi:MAG: hypothetical protein H0U59_03570 [Gemmatimonadaceae bacterium]|nr:hypothetical protein [Gemmatimonadaceae bacterium]
MSNPKHLAGLVSLSGDDAPQWAPQELGAMWKHQLEAPLQFDLSTIAKDVDATITQMTRADPRPLGRFVDLFRHPRPPLELLQWTKDFAKAQTSGEGMPPEIAAALYYASILLARMRCNRRISELDDAALYRGSARIMEQPWLDPETREFFSTALASLKTAADPR